MLKYLFCMIGIILFSTIVMAGETVRLTENIDEHGKRTVYLTTKKTLEKCPAWTLDKEPPFPIYKAVALAQEWIKKKYTKFSSVHVVNISLSRIWDSEYKDRWYYSVTAEAGADIDGVTANSFFSVMVLMDGTVVGPSTPKADEEENCHQDIHPTEKK